MRKTKSSWCVLSGRRVLGCYKTRSAALRAKKAARHGKLGNCIKLSNGKYSCGIVVAGFPGVGTFSKARKRK